MARRYVVLLVAAALAAVPSMSSVEASQSPSPDECEPSAEDSTAPPGPDGTSSTTAPEESDATATTRSPTTTSESSDEADSSSSTTTTSVDDSPTDTTPATSDSSTTSTPRNEPDDAAPQAASTDAEASDASSTSSTAPGASTTSTTSTTSTSGPSTEPEPSTTSTTDVPASDSVTSTSSTTDPSSASTTSTTSAPESSPGSSPTESSSASSSTTSTTDPASSPSEADCVQPAAAEFGAVYRILSWNICGQVCHIYDYAAQEVARKILEQRPHIVTLQEVCAPQFSRVRDLIASPALMDWGGQEAPAPWPMAGVHEATLVGAGLLCDASLGGARHYGIGLLVSEPIVGDFRTVWGQQFPVGEVLELPDFGDPPGYDGDEFCEAGPPGCIEQRKAVCLEFIVPGNPDASQRACTTHLLRGKDDVSTWINARQMYTLADHFGASPAGSPIIIGSDTYRTTAEMATWFPNFNEADDAPIDMTWQNPNCTVCPDKEDGQTYLSQLPAGSPLERPDHISVSDAYRSYGGSVGASHISDHRPLRGTASFAEGSYRQASVDDVPAIFIESVNQGSTHRSGDAYPPESCVSYCHATGDPGPAGVIAPRTVQRSRSTTDSRYHVDVGRMQFDTSGLPDGSRITRAEIQVPIRENLTVDGMSISGEWFDYPAYNPIAFPQFYTSVSSDSAFRQHLIADLLCCGAAYNSFPLRNLEQISLTGLTNIRFHVVGGTPTGSNRVQMTPMVDVNGSGGYLPGRLVLEYEPGA